MGGSGPVQRDACRLEHHVVSEARRQADGSLLRLRLRPPRESRPLSRMRYDSSDEGERVRRLARQLFTFCSAVSLLLCVAVCVLWVWTANDYHVLRFSRIKGDDNRTWQSVDLACHRGLFQLGRMTIRNYPCDPPTEENWHLGQNKRDYT
jgi:hypothetical protein